VKTGDALDIGNGKQLIFVETPMLHWPDSMMTYMTGDAVLFSNDAFGQHYCDERLFNDEVDQTELFEQCQRYYANILTPFSRLVTPKITEILGFNLPVDMIATSHGVVARKPDPDRRAVPEMGGGLSGRPHHDFLRHHVQQHPHDGGRHCPGHQRSGPERGGENLQRGPQR
jgi:hypothetical protein